MTLQVTTNTRFPRTPHEPLFASDKGRLVLTGAFRACLTRLVDQNWLLLLVGVVLPIIVVLFLLRVLNFKRVN